MRRERKIGQVNHLEDVKDADLHWSFDRTMESDYESVEIIFEVVDKQIPRTVIDDGANINIMLASTMQKLGLAIAHPSLYSIRIADQALIKPMGRIKDLTVKTGGVNYQVNFEILPMKRSISTVLNEETYPLLLGRGFLRQCADVVDWSTKKPTFTYGPPNNRTQVLIEPKVERVGVKAATNPVRLLQASTSTDSATKTALHPRIKSFGPGLYDFAEEDGTFAQWLIENPYSDDESSSPRARAIKDSDPANLGAAHSNLQLTAREISEATGSSTPMISNHSVLFVDEILARMVIQVPGLEEDASTSQTYEERQLLRQKHKPMIYKAASPRKVALEASKSISKLLKEAWKIKTKVAAQAKKCFKAVKKMSNLAPFSKTILSFEDWQRKGPDTGHVRNRHLRIPMIGEDISKSGSIHYEE